MSGEEFRRWITHHTNCFPGVRSWMHKNSEDGDIDPILRKWYAVVQDLDFEACVEATSAMHRGDEKVPYTSQHPAAVRAAAKRIEGGEAVATRQRRQAEVIDGQVVYHCHGCLDNGHRIIVKPKLVDTVAAIVREHPDYEIKDLGLSKGRTCVVACNCESGAVFARDRRSRVTGIVSTALPEYDYRKHLRHDPGWTTAQMIEAICEFHTRCLSSAGPVQ
jgi:hypothetical protein